MEILSLDQATLTGWAIVTDGGKLLDAGTWVLQDKRRTGESRGMRYVRFRKNLNDLLNARPEIKLVVHEQTLLRGGAATEIANGLKAIILETAAERNLEVSCVHTTELKKWAAGDGNAKKPAMMGACEQLTGWLSADDNEADAILIGLWSAWKYGSFCPPAPVGIQKEKPKKKRKGL